MRAEDDLEGAQRGFKLLSRSWSATQYFRAQFSCINAKPDVCMLLRLHLMAFTSYPSTA